MPDPDQGSPGEMQVGMTLVVFLMLGIGVLGFIMGMVAMRHAKPIPPRAVSVDIPVPTHEQAALAVMRMGLQRWNAACGHDVAMHKGTRKDALAKCTIDLHIGEER